MVIAPYKNTRETKAKQDTTDKLAETPRESPVSPVDFASHDDKRSSREWFGMFTVVTRYSLAVWFLAAAGVFLALRLLQVRRGDTSSSKEQRMTSPREQTTLRAGVSDGFLETIGRSHVNAPPAASMGHLQTQNGVSPEVF